MYPSFRIIVAVFIATGITGVASAQDSQFSRDSRHRDQYVTHFEKRSKLTYAPRIQMVEKTVSRGSWLPFRSSSELERKLVPVVSWVPKWTTEVIPVTERIAAKKSHRTDPPEEKRSGGLIAIGWVPTPKTASEPIVERGIANFGGIQRLDADTPRIGMKLRELR